MKLSIGISTVKKNKEQAINLARDIISRDSEGFVSTVVILSQFEKFDSQESIDKNIKLYTSTEKGLSNSRNKILSLLDGDFFWLLDDDVQISDDLLSSIKKVCVNNFNFDILVGKIYCSDKNEYFKRYRKNRLGYQGVLGVSSIEMIINRRFINTSNVYYNSSLGLGAKYPCGEENEFLIRCLNKGANIKFVDRVFVKHPSIASLGKNDYFSNKYQVRAKKIVAKVLPLRYRLLYMLRVYFYLIFFKRNWSLAFDLFNFDGKD